MEIQYKKPLFHAILHLWIIARATPIKRSGQVSVLGKNVIYSKWVEIAIVFWYNILISSEIAGGIYAYEWNFYPALAEDIPDFVREKGVNIW